MPIIAFYATQQHSADYQYAKLLIAEKAVYIRAFELPGSPDKWEDDELTIAELHSKPDEVLLNTMEV